MPIFSRGEQGICLKLLLSYHFFYQRILFLLLLGRFVVSTGIGYTREAIIYIFFINTLFCLLTNLYTFL